MTDVKKSIGYTLGASLLVYALIYRLKIPCTGCDTGSYWYRCLEGTGANTQSCEAYKAAETRIDAASGIFEKAGEYAGNLWDFTSVGLPEIVSDFIDTLKKQILGLKDSMAKKIAQIIAFLREKIGLFVAKTKDIVSSSYESYLKKVIDSMVSFAVNNLINPISNIITKIVEFRALVWEKLAEAVQKFADINIFGFVGEVVDIFKKIPEAISGLKDKIVDMVNGVKNGVVSKLNQGVNESAELVEKVVDRVSDLTEDIVDGSETIVNNVINKINQSMNGVENAVDGITGGIESSVNNTVRPIINGVAGAINSARNVKIVGAKPLSFLPTMNTFGGLSIPDLNIPDIKDLNFPDIDFEIDIPTVNIPAPPDINPDNIKFPEIPGFGFITDKIEAIKNSISNIFEKAMDPLYTGIASITLLLGNVVSSVRVFFNRYLSWDSIKKRAGLIMKQISNGAQGMKNFVINEILPAFVTLLKSFWKVLYDFVKKVAETSWKFIKKVGGTVGKMFNEVYRVVVKVTGAVARGVMGTGMYVVSSTVDKYTAFVPISLTLKMLAIAATIIWMFTGQFVKNGADIFNLVYGGMKIGAVALSDLDSLVDAKAMEAFPSLKL